MPTQTDEQKKRAYQAAGLPIPATDIAPKPIDVSAITAPTTINIPPIQPVSSADYTKVVLSPAPIVNTPAQDTLQTKRASIIGDITAAGEKLGTKAARKTELETQANVPALKQQLNELTQQIRGIQSESFTATQKAEDRLAPTFAIQGEQAQIERQRAVRVYGLAAAAEAVQGNIALADDHVQRALDAEFGGLEKEIENKKFLLSVNMDNFSTEEKRRAEAAQVALDQQKEALGAQKAERENILKIMLEAAKAGADNATLNRIQSTKTPEMALQAASKFLKDPNAELQTQLLREQIANARANRANQATQTLIDRAKLGDATALQQLGITPNPSGKLRVDQKEAAALNKEIGQNDTYKAIDKAMSSWRALKEYEKAATSAKNPIFNPIQANDANAKYNTALLNLKEYYNLGVLNGPDLPLMQKLLPSVVKGTVSTGASFTIVGGFATNYLIKAKVQNAIKNQKVQFEDKLDSDYLTVKSQYSSYDPAQVTLLKDIDRKYLQMKVEINPGVAQFLKENPDLTLEEQLQVINQRL